jgi:nitrite reductase/ring-hydroxylating ferredoxin subunit/DMSO/TMAO reductase YedYZ heme-binding membrane subunit
VSHAYQAVQWTAQKKAYDVWLAAGVLGYLLAFAGLDLALHPDTTAETLALRALGSAAFLGLCIALSIGPLCRLDPRFLPLLYNRRHLGVSVFVLALAHAALAVVQFHGSGDLDPLVSLLSANPRSDSLAQFPFELLGVAALAILFAMAATSHDFWLVNLTAPVWKALHLGVYAAYALAVMHVALGALQAETHPALALALGASCLWLVGLHGLAAARERRVDRAGPEPAPDGWIDVCAADEIPERRARVVSAGGERVAVFRHGGRISALSNVCQHQNGPLGEGEIVDGLVTCPWHGFQYRPECGRAPEPFRERVATFRVRLRGGRVQLDPRPLPPGTHVEPARVPDA